MVSSEKILLLNAWLVLKDYEFPLWHILLILKEIHAYVVLKVNIDFIYYVPACFGFIIIEACEI